jgi:hypothetical protein
MGMKRLGVAVVVWTMMVASLSAQTITLRTDQKIKLSAYGIAADTQRTTLPAEVVPPGGRAEALRPGDVVYIEGATPPVQPKYPAPSVAARVYDWSVVDANDPHLTAPCGSLPPPSVCNPFTNRYEPLRLATGVKGLLVLDVSADGKECTLLPNGAAAFPDLNGTFYPDGIGEFEVHVRYGDPAKGFTDATLFGVIKVTLIKPTMGIAASSPEPK